MEAHAFSGQLQRDMIERVDRVQPAFLVLVNVDTSRTMQPDSSHLLLDWAAKTVDQDYEPVASADIIPGETTVYRWEAERAGCTAPLALLRRPLPPPAAGGPRGGSPVARRRLQAAATRSVSRSRPVRPALPSVFDDSAARRIPGRAAPDREPASFPRPDALPSPRAVSRIRLLTRKSGSPCWRVPRTRRARATRGRPPRS